LAQRISLRAGLAAAISVLKILAKPKSDLKKLHKWVLSRLAKVIESHDETIWPEARFQNGPICWRASQRRDEIFARRLGPRIDLWHIREVRNGIEI
jgi:hypothetical protein